MSVMGDTALEGPLLHRVGHLVCHVNGDLLALCNTRFQLRKRSRRETVLHLTLIEEIATKILLQIEGSTVLQRACLGSVGHVLLCREERRSEDRVVWKTPSPSDVGGRIRLLSPTELKFKEVPKHCGRNRFVETKFR